jgi:hypothetical protein
MFGFGNGTTTRHDKTARDADGAVVRSRFDNGMTAHVWAQHSQTFGQSGNGNFYFEGRALYSYGRHYVAGYLAPAVGDLSGVGLALINSDSNSVTTAGHVSDAAGASRHLGRVWTPALGNVADIFESAYREARGERLNPGEAPALFGEPCRKAFAAHALPALVKHFANHENLPTDGRNVGAESTPRDTESAVAAILEAAQIDAPARRARAIVKKAIRALELANLAAAKAERADSLRELARFASTGDNTPRGQTVAAAIAERMESDAVAVARGARRGFGYHARADTCDAWADKGKAILRAMKTGKAAGRVAQVRKAGEVRKAIRANLWRFEAAAIRANRVRYWKGELADVRAALAMAPELATGRAPIARGGYVMRQGGVAARDLSERLAPLNGGEAWAAKACRVAGGVPVELANRLRELAAELDRLADKADARQRLATERGDVQGVRATLAMAPDAPAATRHATFRTAHAFASRFAARVPAYNGDTGSPYSKAPGAWRLAGWTPERFATLAATFKTGLDAAALEVREASERVARERNAAQVKLKAAALEAWRAGEPLQGELAKYRPDADATGGAYIRATGVQRDAAGAITGGELETSQGATAPLAHALRVFAFLKACRVAGKGWRSNGRALRVGHFNVDSVSASGDFVAGCHKFAWVEVETLAVRLGVESLAPADTTENAHAHA